MSADEAERKRSSASKDVNANVNANGGANANVNVNVNANEPESGRARALVAQSGDVERFRDEPVPRPVLDSIIEASTGLWPTRFARPPFRVMVVVGAERERLIGRMAESLARHWGLGTLGPRGLASEAVLNAPALILIFSISPASEGGGDLRCGGRRGAEPHPPRASGGARHAPHPERARGARGDARLRRRFSRPRDSAAASWSRSWRWAGPTVRCRRRRGPACRPPGLGTAVAPRPS